MHSLWRSTQCHRSVAVTASVLANRETGVSSGDTWNNRNQFKAAFSPLVPEGKMVREISMFPISTLVKASCQM